MPPAAADEVHVQQRTAGSDEVGRACVRHQLAGVGAAHQLVEFVDAQAAGVGVELAERRCPLYWLRGPEPGASLFSGPSGWLSVW